MVLRRWERSKQEFSFIKRVDKTKFLPWYSNLDSWLKNVSRHKLSFKTFWAVFELDVKTFQWQEEHRTINFLYILTSYSFSIDFRLCRDCQSRLFTDVFIFYLWTQNVEINKDSSLEELIKVHNTGKTLFGLLEGLIFPRFFLCAFTVRCECAGKTSQ